MHRWVAALLVLGGCSLSEEQFAEDFTEAECEWTVECYPAVYASVEECVSDGPAIQPAGDDCTYDAKAARDCISGTNALECPTDGSFPERPAACDDVFTCGGEG